MTSEDKQTDIGLCEKLDPRRFPSISPMFGAIVAYIVGERLADQAIAEMTVTSDDIVMARVDGDTGFNNIIGSFSDLVSNWVSLLGVAGLTDSEHHAAEMLFAKALGRSYNLKIATVNSSE